MKARFVFLLAIGVAALLGATAARAIPIFDVNFNDDTIGNPPSTSATPVSDVYVKPTSVTFTTPANKGTTVRVESSFTAGSATLSDQPLVITYNPDGISPTPNDSFFVNFLSAASYVDNVSPYMISFDFIVATNLGNSTNRFELGVYGGDGATSNNATRIGRLIFLANGGLLFFSGNQGTSVSVSNVWSHDTLNQTALVLTPSDRSLKLYINNDLKADLTVSSDVLDENLGVRFFRLVSGSTNGQWTGAFDNFATAIPEPGTAGLFLAAAGLLGLRALRRRGC